MTTEKKDKALKLKKKIPVKGVAGFIFSSVGVSVSLLAFFVLNVFIQNLIRDEYNRQGQHHVEVLVKNLADLQGSLDSLSTLFYWAENKGGALAEIDEEFRNALPNLGRFDQIVVIQQKNQKEWHTKTFNKRPHAALNPDLTYALKIEESVLKKLLPGAATAGRDVRVALGEAYFQPSDAAPFRHIRSFPFALVKTVEPGAPDKGVVVAVSNITGVVDRAWYADERLLMLSIHDVKTGQMLFEYLPEQDKAGGGDDQEQVYEFPLGEEKWEVRLRFIETPLTSFLRSIPYMVLAFGLMLTAMGVHFVASKQKQARTLKIMNHVLARKNSEMQDEIKKREHLNNFLQKSETERQALIDSVNDIIFEADAEGRLLFLNAAWLKITGFDPDQSRGADFFTMLHPSDQDAQRKDFQLFIRKKKQIYRTLTQLRTVQGGFRAVELAICMLRLDAGGQIRVVGTITDLEDHRRTEKALSEAEKKYRAMVENTASGIFQLTPEGLYLSANPAFARILGYASVEQLLYAIKDAHTEIYVDVRDRRAVLSELELRNALSNQELRVRRQDGEIIWVNENIRVVRDDTDQILYYEGSLEDITKSKQTEIALREAKIHSDLANRAKSEFLANMSHELRTPLNAIIGFSEMMKNEVHGPIHPVTYRDYALDIHGSGNKLLGVINEILDISKIEAGQRALNEAVVNVEDVIGACLELLKVKIETHNLSISRKLGYCPPVIGEELALKQVFMNILSNAVKFTPNGGYITINGLQEEDGGFRVSFTDTGIGLTDQEIKKALSPFGQMDSGRNKSGKGTGLGLTLVDALVRLHGGRLEIVSQKGIGTTVSVILPPARVAEEGEDTPPSVIKKQNSAVVKA